MGKMFNLFRLSEDIKSKHEQDPYDDTQCLKCQEEFPCDIWILADTIQKEL